MESQRHTPLEPVLAAARACVLDVGLRRTTLADVARRAGLSRMTVYRQWGDLETIVSALLTTELVALIEDAGEQVAGVPPPASGWSRRPSSSSRSWPATRSMRKVLEVDPELLLPLVVDRFGSTQRAAVDLVASQVREGQPTAASARSTPSWPRPACC